MTDIESYVNLITTTFGLSIFDCESCEGNSLTKALDQNSMFPVFRNNFIIRLNKLSKIYNDDGPNRKKIITVLKEIATRNNWEGAYSEFVAYASLNTGDCWLRVPIQLDNNLAADETFANEFGKANINLDGYYEDYGVYFDVKCLKDNVKDILDGIYLELEEKFQKKFYVLKEYDLSESHDDISQCRRLLLDELVTSIVPGETVRFGSKVIKNLTLIFKWKPSVCGVVNCYDPYGHAVNTHRLVFSHVNKYTINRPFFLVFVVFPWFNGLIRKFSQMNIKYYRSFARRVFCQYKHSSQGFSELDSHFKGKQSVYDVSKKLSGIIFIEDESINSDSTNNTKIYCYFNPNAEHRLSDRLIREYFIELKPHEYDDFRNDNY